MLASVTLDFAQPMRPPDRDPEPPRGRRSFAGGVYRLALAGVVMVAGPVGVGAAQGAVQAAQGTAVWPQGLAPDAQGYDLEGPLQCRDMMAFELPRLEMLPTEGSAASGQGWSVEAGLTYVNTFAMSDKALNLLARLGRRRPLGRREAAALLGLPGDFYYVDGEFALLTPTVRYRFDQRASVYLVWPVLSFGGGIFDTVIEGFHRGFGLPNGNRELVARNEFNVIYRIGREQVVERGPPAGGLSDPIAGLRYRLLPPASRWDLIVSGAVKIATRSRSALSTGGSDLGLQLALHRTFRRQSFYLDLSAVHLGGMLPDPRVDRRGIPSFVAAYELGLSHRTSTVVQLYVSPGVFRQAQPAELRQPRYHVLVGLRSRRGPLTWHLTFIEKLVYHKNTPDVGAQVGVSWSPGRAANADPT